MAWIGLLMYAGAQSAHSLCSLVRNTAHGSLLVRVWRSSMRWVSPDMTCSSTAGRDTMNGACRQIQDLIVLHRPRNSNEAYSGGGGGGGGAGGGGGEGGGGRGGGGGAGGGGGGGGQGEERGGKGGAGRERGGGEEEGTED